MSYYLTKLDMTSERGTVTTTAILERPRQIGIYADPTPTRITLEGDGALYNQLIEAFNSKPIHAIRFAVKIDIVEVTP